MKDLFRALAAQLDRGAVLCTIAASRGSTPRGAGARMLVTAAGRAAGTVGGGEVERRAEALAVSMLAEKPGAGRRGSGQRPRPSPGRARSGR